MRKNRYTDDMRIGIDIDEIIAATLEAMLRYHNGVYGTDLKHEDVFSYKLWEVWGGSEEEAIQKWHDFYDTDHFAGICPVAGAGSALAALRESGHELFAITARPHLIAKQTEYWLDANFPEAFAGVRFANTYGKGGAKLKKSALCSELGVGVLVEDDPRHAIDCANNGIDVILFDYPWNRVAFPDNVHRVYSWDDAVRLIA